MCFLIWLWSFLFFLMCFFNLIWNHLYWFLGWVFVEGFFEWVFLSLWFCNFPGPTPCWFLKPAVLEAHLSMQDPRVGLPDVELWSLLREIRFLWGPWNVVPGVWLFPYQECISAISTHLGAVSCCGGSVHPISKSPSEWIMPYVAAHLLCLWGEVSSGSFYSAISNLLPLFILLYYSELLHWQTFLSNVFWCE